MDCNSSTEDLLADYYEAVGFVKKALSEPLSLNHVKREASWPGARPEGTATF